MDRRPSAPSLLALGLVAAVALPAAGCRVTRSPYVDRKKIEEPTVPPGDPDMPVQVEKIQVGRGGPIGYIRIQTRWLDDRERRKYTTTWVYDTDFRARGMWAESGDTIRFKLDGREENMGIQPRSIAFYALLSGRDRFPEDQYDEPEILYLKMETPRSGLEKPGKPDDGS